MKLGDVVEVNIEKTVFGGDGLARYGEDNFVIFVENALAQDKLKVEITSFR